MSFTSVESFILVSRDQGWNRSATEDFIYFRNASVWKWLILFKPLVHSVIPNLDLLVPGSEGASLATSAGRAQSGSERARRDCQQRELGHHGIGNLRSLRPCDSHSGKGTISLPSDGREMPHSHGMTCTSRTPISQKESLADLHLRCRAQQSWSV